MEVEYADRVMFTENVFPRRKLQNVFEGIIDNIESNVIVNTLDILLKRHKCL